MIFPMRRSEKVLALLRPAPAIIEKLVASGFVERKGKYLIPTKDGINLVSVLPEQMTSPSNDSGMGKHAHGD